MRRWIGVFLALTMGVGARAEESWDAVVAAARKEGSGAVYSALSGPPTIARF